MGKDYEISNQLTEAGFEVLYDADRVSKMIPKRPGVYCFVEWDIMQKRAAIIYVGKSIDLSVRLKPWHRVEAINGGCTSCYILLTEDITETEIHYIRTFTPKYNVQHNPKIRRIITYV